MIEKKLAKITCFRFGFGGYQDAMFGATFSLGNDGWGVQDFWGAWAEPPSEHAKWTVQDQSKIFADATRKLIELCKKAKVVDSSKLVGVPVEVVFEDMVLKSWRILEEVL